MEIVTIGDTLSEAWLLGVCEYRRKGRRRLPGFFESQIGAESISREPGPGPWGARFQGRSLQSETAFEEGRQARWREGGIGGFFACNLISKGSPVFFLPAILRQRERGRLRGARQIADWFCCVGLGQSTIRDGKYH